ncbi:MAG TPA: glycoside hydrolase family 2 TIM barrel-domain containing protein, partial [Fimbriimonadaceae bacterium]|nr:glycoside hydrolase family 2 TIM barrel-domain containing protein [Fimbriimonadaceae bacterium]
QPTADIHVAASIDNTLGRPAFCIVKSEIVAPSGRLYELPSSRVRVEANSSIDVSSDLTTSAPELWSIEKPQLYRVRTTIMRDSRIVDAVETSFGLRTIYFDPNQGFFLNGKRVELKGTCNHQDHAGVGIAMPDSLIDWRIRKLKEMGSNAYRCSHNPPAAELLDACDRLGMVVMDETRHLGDTVSPKTASGTGTSDLSELRSMILRDRNHPSVIMWSLFNEEGLQGTEEGAKIFTAMRDAVRKLDPTRPCTGAMNGGWGHGITLVEDLQGFNYGIPGYDRMHVAFPNLPMYGSETASTVGTRGIYANDAKAGYVSVYDVNKPGWGATAEESWSAIASRPWMAGEFVWTGFDYKGEPTPYGWPCINSHFGIMDICGFPKDNFFYYQAVWGDKPIVHILPHWNWAGKEGKPIDVWVYTNGTSVELSLNGKSLGKKTVPAYGHTAWSVPYQPGWLVAVAYRDGKAIAREQIATAGVPAAIRLKTSTPKIDADREEVSPVEVEIVDAKGRVVPTASNLVSFKVSGASVVGVGNGDPSSHEPDEATKRHAFNGYCMALVGAATRPGRIVVTATSPGLRSATLVLTGVKSESK